MITDLRVFIFILLTLLFAFYVENAIKTENLSSTNREKWLTKLSLSLAAIS